MCTNEWNDQIKEGINSVSYVVTTSLLHITYVNLLKSISAKISLSVALGTVKWVCLLQWQLLVPNGAQKINWHPFSTWVSILFWNFLCTSTLYVPLSHAGMYDFAAYLHKTFHSRGKGSQGWWSLLLLQEHHSWIICTKTCALSRLSFQFGGQLAFCISSAS